MMTEALSLLDEVIRKPSDVLRQRMWELLDRLRDEQNEYQRIKWGSVRIIRDYGMFERREAPQYYPPVEPETARARSGKPGERTSELHPARTR